MRLHEDELDGIMDFMLTADKLKGTDRTGWVMRGVKDPEHVGDHSFSTALLSYALASRMGLDAEKCMTMALIHDIAEAKVGDIATRAREEDQTVSNAEKARLEGAAMTEIMSLLDSGLASRLRALWDDFESGGSEEAKLVKQVDKLDYILMTLEYLRYLGDDALGEFFQTAGDRIDVPEVRYLYDRVANKLAETRKR